MNRFAVCRADELSLSAGERSLRFGRDAIIDLDQVVVPADPGTTPPTPAQTVRDLVRLDACEVLDVPTAEAAADLVAARMKAADAATMTASDETADPPSDATAIEPAETSPRSPDKAAAGRRGTGRGAGASQEN